MTYWQQDWQSNSQCSHATASSVEGPFTYQGAAVEVWCHNPQVVVLAGGLYALFHIGDGDGGNPVNCTSNVEHTNVRALAACHFALCVCVRGA